MQTELIKAARQALKVMGLIGADLVCEAAHHEKRDRHGIGEPCAIQARWHGAFTALRAALEQPAQDEPFGYFRYDMRLDAWVQNREGKRPGTPFYTRPQPVPTSDTSQKPVDETAKQRHEWAGLTKEEAEQLVEDNDWYNDPVGFCFDVEAKLKKKNA